MFRKGNNNLKVGLVQAAHAANRTKGYLALSIVVLLLNAVKKEQLWLLHIRFLKSPTTYLILRQETYQDLGGDYFDKQKPEATKKRLVKRLH